MLIYMWRSVNLLIIWYYYEWGIAFLLCQLDTTCLDSQGIFSRHIRKWEVMEKVNSLCCLVVGKQDARASIWRSWMKMVLCNVDCRQKLPCGTWDDNYC